MDERMIIMPFEAISHLERRREMKTSLKAKI
jgi:hypothetical protein